MKPNSALTILVKLAVFLLLFAALFSACVAKMLVEEAKKVTVSMGDQSLGEMLLSGKIAASYAHPLFWAPFIMVGESGDHVN